MPDELVVGTIIGVQEHPGARAPSLLLTVDLGQYGTREVVLSSGSYAADDLERTQVVCRRTDDAALVVAAHSHGRGLILLRPDNEVEPGTLVD